LWKRKTEFEDVRKVFMRDLAVDHDVDKHPREVPHLGTMSSL